MIEKTQNKSDKNFKTESPVAKPSSNSAKIFSGHAQISSEYLYLNLKPIVKKTGGAYLLGSSIELMDKILLVSVIVTRSSPSPTATISYDINGKIYKESISDIAIGSTTICNKKFHFK